MEIQTLDSIIDRLTKYRNRLTSEFPGIIVSEYVVDLVAKLDGGTVQGCVIVDSIDMLMGEQTGPLIRITLREAP